MRRVIVLALAITSFSTRAQNPTVQYYYSPEPQDVCAVDPGSPCSIVECGLGWRCACPLELPNGWKRPLTKEQCESARRKLPLYPAEEVRRHHGYERKKTEASASSTPKGSDQPLDEKDIVSPRSEAARKLPDDQVCKLVSTGGGDIKPRPKTCKYLCGAVFVCVEVDFPSICPSGPGPTSATRWKNIKGLRPCKPKQ